MACNSNHQFDNELPKYFQRNMDPSRQLLLCEEDEENTNAIDCHNCACNNRCPFGDIDVVDDGYCHS